MSQIYLYQNSLNKNEVDVIDTDNILFEFLKVKQFPQAKFISVILARKMT
ncbi:hypothetical protein BANRA_02534 [Acinetobacter baumannii]|nr:hypothetical protein BANRA_02534 [Acinetobacter baumannii]